MKKDNCDNCIELKVYTDNSGKIQPVMECFSSGDIRPGLDEIKQKFLVLSNRLTKNENQDKKNLALSNFLLASVPYLELTAKHQRDYVQILAFCLRNIFEIHLCSRFVQINENNLQIWCLEAQYDKDELLDVLKKLIPDDSEISTAIKQEKIRRQTLFEKNDMQMPDNYLRTRAMAKVLGKESEFLTFHKITSKFIHPTSFLVNSSQEEIQRDEYRKTFIIHILLYSWDIHDNIENQVFATSY